jgi:hypothetical protein
MMSLSGSFAIESYSRPAGPKTQLSIRHSDGLTAASGKSVLYHAQFLWDVREHDGNVALPDDAAAKDEAIVLPE